MQLLKRFWEEQIDSDHLQSDWWKNLKDFYEKRNSKIVKVTGKGHIYQRIKYDREEKIYYHLHVTILARQGSHFFMEERTIPYEFVLKSGEIYQHKETNTVDEEEAGKIEPVKEVFSREERFAYDRRAAVQYAERWWNSYNPAYRTFDVDCTNFISQCLRAGGAPMRGAPNRNQGWWYTGDNWSYSWSVAHSMRWYLSGSTTGLKGTEVESPTELQPGDVICYDFEGDGKWDHTTIVVTKDSNGMPLVNAHTQNSRHRYWSYEDSTAYTPNIQYKFFRIGD